VAFSGRALRHETSPSLHMRACLYRASALPARNGMFALPGLPALAAKSRGDHPCRKAAEQRVFYGTESVTDEKLVVNGAEVTLVHVALWL